ncbi:MAG TPA: hypothetical protein VK307_07050 [Thermoleophilaceae bacterium]|nr:hypothetical protein [Thermoleophilaceae bacterium]
MRTRSLGSLVLRLFLERMPEFEETLGRCEQVGNTVTPRSVERSAAAPAQ